MEKGQEDFWALRKLIREFEKLDTELKGKYTIFINILSKGEIDYESVKKYYEALKAKREIKIYLENNVHIKASHYLARQLKNIRDNKGYWVDKFFDIISEINENSSQEIENDFDATEAFYGSGLIDYIDENYHRRKRQVGAVVINKSFAENFIFHLKKVKECYSLGLFEAASIYCRALIEAATQNYLGKKDDKMSHIKEDVKLSELLGRIRKYKPNKQMIDGAYEVKNIANNQLHGEKLIKIDEEKAYEAIKKTFAYIEYIFE